jgi:hypothetical protein
LEAEADAWSLHNDPQSGGRAAALQNLLGAANRGARRQARVRAALNPQPLLRGKTQRVRRPQRLGDPAILLNVDGGDAKRWQGQGQSGAADGHGADGDWGYCSLALR